MEQFTIEELKNSEKFIQNIRWDITPRKFLEPTLAKSEEIGDKTDKYMLYVDIVFNKPQVVIMRLREHMSKTVGYIDGVPHELLKEALNCDKEECKAGMYPLTPMLEEWLKKRLGLLMK